MLSSLPGMGRSTVVWVAVGVDQGYCCDAHALGFLDGNILTFGVHHDHGVGRRFMSRMPCRLRLILVSSRVNWATIFLLCVRIDADSGALLSRACPSR